MKQFFTYSLFLSSSPEVIRYVGGAYGNRNRPTDHLKAALKCGAERHAAGKCREGNKVRCDWLREHAAEVQWKIRCRTDCAETTRDLETESWDEDLAAGHPVDQLQRRPNTWHTPPSVAGKLGGRAAAVSMTQEQKTDRARKGNAALTFAHRSAAGKKGGASLTKEQYAAAGRRAGEVMTTAQKRARYAAGVGKDPGRLSEWGRRGAFISGLGKNPRDVMTPEQLSARSKKSSASMTAAARHKRAMAMVEGRRRAARERAARQA